MAMAAAAVTPVIAAGVYSLVESYLKKRFSKKDDQSICDFLAHKGFDYTLDQVSYLKGTVESQLKEYYEKDPHQVFANLGFSQRSIHFCIQNDCTKESFDIQLEKHPLESGEMVEGAGTNSLLIKPIQPTQSMKINFFNGAFYGVRGALVFSVKSLVHGNNEEYFIAIAFRNLKVQMRKKSRNRIAGKFITKEEVENLTVHGITHDSNSKKSFARDGFLDFNENEKMFLRAKISQSSRAICDIHISDKNIREVHRILHHGDSYNLDSKNDATKEDDKALDPESNGHQQSSEQ